MYSIASFGWQLKSKKKSDFRDNEKIAIDK